ncbi:MAG: hypothetical protein JSV03_09540 [Planctomycetota bacterium]|nr:MAG: hypothetical protein JSV03_09540 [Planctomycetota bacterium]
MQAQTKGKGMTSRGTDEIIFLITLFATLLGSTIKTNTLFAQTTPAGIIRHDVVWSGQINITGDVTVIDATIRVEPGSKIRFLSAGYTTFGPVLRLNSPSLLAGREATCAKLILAGTTQRPIIVETPQDMPPGAIVAGPRTCGSIIARHVIFRRLGTPTSDKRSKPSIQLQLASPDNDFWISDCRFENCGPVRGEFFGPGAGAQIEKNVFANTSGDVTLFITGTGSGIKVIAGNIADAAFRIECPQTLIVDNILVGESAAITIPAANAGAVTIARNYVHCTTGRDQGKYVLRCQTTEAVVKDNVLIGGTYVIESAPRLVKGNVLIGVAGLEATFNVPDLDVKKLKSTTMTHYLITNLAPQAVVADNLLLGPCYAAVATGKRTDSPRIEHNLFDGWNQAHRAVHFNRLTRKPSAAELNRNIIIRYKNPPLCDQARVANTLARAGKNVFADVPEVLYEKIDTITGLAPGDKRLDNFNQIGFQSPLTTQTVDSYQDRLLKRQITVDQIRDVWFVAYRLRKDAPFMQTDPIGPR